MGNGIIIIIRVNAISIDTSLPKGMETEPLLWAFKENCKLLIIVRRPRLPEVPALAVQGQALALELPALAVPE